MKADSNAFAMFVVLSCLSAVGGCAALSSPPSISDPGGVPVHEIIRQIKCELMHSIAEPMEDKRLKWFQSWTAKIDLTLNVSTLDQLTPTVVFNHPLHNAYPNVGTSSLPGATLAALQQKFTFGVGGGVSDLRTRSEDFIFTVSFDGLKQEFESLRKKDPRYAVCLDANAELTSSNLDMKSWIYKRMLSMVTEIDGYPAVLTEGYQHQAATGFNPKAAPAPSPRSQYAAGVTPKKMLEQAIAGKKHADAVNDYLKSELSIARKIGAACAAKFKDVASDAAAQAAIAAEQLDIAQTAEKATQPDKPEGAEKEKAKEELSTAGELIDDAKAQADLDVKAVQGIATECVKGIKAPAKNPPLDVVSTSYQFAVAANIGIAPSWALVKITGPSGTGSAASVAGSWTNNLSLILAPSASTANQEVLNQQLIQILRRPTGLVLSPAF